MSIDFVYLLEGGAGLATVAVALLTVYRSITIGKSLVTRVYRSRAYWLALLMIILVVDNLPFPPSSAIGSFLGFYGFFVFLFAFIIFIDSNVAVAREIDFFHKDILHWRKVRIPMFAILGAYTVAAAIFSPAAATSIVVGIGIVGYFTMLGAIFVYAGVAMFVIGRRTYDQTMRTFIKMLGFAVLCYLLFVTIWLPLDFVYPNLGDILTDFILIGGAYFFYKAAMSLSFVGRIVEEVA
jgi:hypothetical protein